METNEEIEVEETLEPGSAEPEETDQDHQGPVSDIQDIDEDQELDKAPVGIFVDKNEFLDVTRTIKILGLQTSKYEGRERKNILFKFKEQSEEDATEYLMNLNTTNYNWLVSNKGNKVSMWKQGFVDVSGENFQGTDKNGQEMKGVSVSFRKYKELSGEE